MRLAVFGGSFNPPHSGHVKAAEAALEALGAEKLLIIPSAGSPHKEQPAGSPTPEERLHLARLAFEGVARVEVLDIEIKRGGVSYTIDTLRQLRQLYPKDELFLLMGSDMLMSFERWKDFRDVTGLAALAAFSREGDLSVALENKCAELERQGIARPRLIALEPVEISSTELRRLLPERKGCDKTPEAVYAEIIRRRFYGAQPDLSWLRERVLPFIGEKRVKHVLGTAREALKLATRWGTDAALAAEAALLHDITKKQNAEEQLHLCEIYGIMADVDERSSFKLLHAKTGAELSRRLFGINDEVYGAIRWHTTGKPDMSLPEKVIYLSDYIEPTRDFDGLDELRALAYTDIDEALILGLEMSLKDLISQGKKPHANTLDALGYLLEHRGTGN
ncbi:MAG: nicotinate (nicotinamide) nucleotide adenylyltransferase [Oscillospiraceae bacterium]|jgi:nicotinate-nucleotide adenylyltransferase|nr:nicotinate (nicotinamide) nucleotide adenylyltransferase [Oscillospiraceae bacterium]